MEAETTAAASNVAGDGAGQKAPQAPEGHSVTKRLQSELMQLMVS